MTEKIKDRITGWLITLLFTLLSLITGGIGYLIVRGDAVNDAQNLSINELKQSSMEHENMLMNLIEVYNGKKEKDKEQDTKIEKQNEQIIELWKSSKRSGNNNLSLIPYQNQF